MMGQVVFIVARESVEALLIIGILWAWMARRPDARTGRAWLLGGIVAGFALATALALTLVGVATFLGATARSWFEVGMLTLAAVLIVQMVFWMRQNGRTLRRDLEDGLDRSVATSRWWGVFALAAIAIGREGSETVVFLYGSFLRLQTLGDFAAFAASAGVGLGIALLLFWGLQAGARFISWRWFFRVTEWMLLFLGSALFLTAMGKLLSVHLSSVDLPGWVYSTVWDSSAILSDSSVLGSLLSTLAAYRSQPIGWDIVMLILYWGAVAGLFAWQNRRLGAARAVAA
ncbi:FTR1 family iron permease [Falsirhodobacter algicola]|uniref:FTR1 family iron permease n=1 Tax=Falsirhodobacter algicola TaxID=2692330 RepID=A0A8J8SK93_9RHOB|nr:FTR1 family protein [Falsirhodobacter algicola]QUS35276.1 FTR1 family iron permease [Falsirhodobacter algicola]